MRKIVVALLAILLAIITVLGWAAIAPATQVQFAISPQFDVAADFADGLAKVGYVKTPSTQNGYGYIDRSGKLVIPAMYRSAENFAEGLAAVAIHQDGRSDRYGYIDKKGKTVIAPRFLSAGQFFAGLAPVTTDTDLGYINRSGRLVLKLNYQSFAEFHEGLARVGKDTKALPPNATRYGYINQRGKLVIPWQFTSAKNFSQGLAAVETARHKGYINKQGKFMIRNPQLDMYVAGDFSEGLAAAELGSGACSAAAYCDYVYIDRQGKVAIQPLARQHFTRAGDFVDGLAPVATSGGGRDAGGFFPVGGWGFINKRGKFIIAPQFDDAGSFAEGLARVSVDGKYGYIRYPAR